jgi:hypothetical protein
MEKFGYTILGFLLGLWLLRMSRKYGLVNVFDALSQGLGKHLVELITILLIIFSLYLFGR